jgi:hypothetical protein
MAALRYCAVAAALVLRVLGEPCAASAASPNGSQFQVNTHTTDAQFTASVTSDSSGGFGVVWQSYGSAGSDASGISVQGQTYDASGAPIGSQFQVNTYTTSNQRLPSVATDSSGHLVVVWTSFGSEGSDTSGESVQGQLYLPEPSFVPSAGAVLAMVVALARRRQKH